MQRIVQLTPYGLQFYHAANFPYGLRCTWCGYLFTMEWEPIAEMLTYRQEGTLVVELVCMQCSKADQ